MIVHHFVSFIPIENPSKLSTFNKRILFRRSFTAIASIFYPVGMTKNIKIDFQGKLLMQITATQVFAHHSVSFIPI